MAVVSLNPPDPDAWDKFGRWFRRSPLAASGAVVFGVILAFALGGFTISALNVKQEVNIRNGPQGATAGVDAGEPTPAMTASPESATSPLSNETPRPSSNPPETPVTPGSRQSGVAVADEDMTPTFTAVSAVQLTAIPTATSAPLPSLVVLQPTDGDTVGGVYEIRGTSTDLAGKNIYLAMQDVFPFPEYCEDPQCPHIWMEFQVAVKSSGEFRTDACFCVDGGKYEIVFLYGVTAEGEAALQSWLQDADRGRTKVPLLGEGVIALGQNLVVTADHSGGRQPPATACSPHPTPLPSTPGS